MKALIADDDFISYRLLEKILTPFGACDIAKDGAEAVRLFESALQSTQPYDLVCLDIMMPKMNGQEVLKTIRRLEREQEVAEENEAKIFMTTALDSPQNVVDAYFRGGCSAYLVKPIKKQEVQLLLSEGGLI